MRIGLIARCENARGLAIQSKSFYDHMPVDKVLLVRMPRPTLDCVEAPEWYPGATHIDYDGLNHTLPEHEVRDWMMGLDVIFTAETTYDWSLPDWARSMGVKTVVQGNPEFFRHDQPEFGYKAHPDEWWWPTTWRMDRLPPGRHMPCPMPDMEPTARQGGPVAFVHVVGKRAYEDRNGTDIVFGAIRGIEEECDFTIYGLGHNLPEFQLPPSSPVRLRLEPAGLDDRWELYRDQSILVLPRRYGGNCLPALEAAACGLGVLMPNISPNAELASLLVPCRDDRSVKLAAGFIQMADVDQYQLGRTLTQIARVPDDVERMQQRSRSAVPRWGEYRSMCLEALEGVCRR